MYGQGNYPPQHSQGSQPPPPFPQRPVNPHFQYSVPFQYQQPPPPPPRTQHDLPTQNAPHPYQLPPGPSQAAMWGRDSQRLPPPPPPPLAPLPLGPNRSEMFRPSIPFSGFHPTPPPPPLPTSSFFTPAPMFSTNPSPPPPQPRPLPPTSPPPAPPSPPPPTPPSTSEVSLDSADKVASTSKIMVDTTTAVDSNDPTDGNALKELDLPLPPPKPAEENVVKRIEDMCDSIAKNGLGFECVTRQKESGNPGFRFLFAGEVGSEDAVAHEYFKWARKKCLLQRKKSNAAPKLPNMSTLSRTSSIKADVSPSVSDMEMEDDFIQPDEVHFESVSSPEDSGYKEQLYAPQDDVECSPFKENESKCEEEKATESTLLHQNDIDSLNTSPYRAVEEDPNPIKSADELNKSPSPIKLLQDYASDDSSEHDNKQYNFQAGQESMNLPSADLAFEKSSEPVKAENFIEGNESVVSPRKEALQVVEEAAAPEDVQHVSTHKKVDEFGRLIRDVASHSGSDDSYRVRSHGKRERSRSRSPHDRRSRWSPRRRRERRSRSPGWSPRKRRSRSRSPSYRRGSESVVETVKRDKCFDFLRGRCYRGSSCRFMHQEMDKNVGSRYDRNKRISDRHVATERSPPRRSIHEHDLPERLSTEIKEESLESTIKLHGTEDCREKEETEELVIDKSQANISVLDITSAIGEDQIETSEPELNRNASINPNQGAHLEPPLLPQITFVPPYQAQSQMQPLHYPTPPTTWPLPPPPPLQTPLQHQFSHNFTAPNVNQGVGTPFHQNQFGSRNDYGMYQQQNYPAPLSQTEDLQSKPMNQGHLSSFPPPSLGQFGTYIQQQQPHFSLPQSSSDGLRFGAYANVSAPYGGSQITHHYNPYASTFDQPFESKINSNVLNQGKDLLETKTENQYDPLFDSIEPPSTSVKKIDEGQGLESALRLSSSRDHQLDVGESYKQKEAVEVAAAISTPTKSNGEFGEVESGKSSNPNLGGPTALGEIEIEQVKTPGKEKKSKDSRSMKLFKSSIADYVKEVLKPHWRQGGMSKEAFKIIVKKTIDKVCGATKSHHIPKSQEKINRYIDTSERKLNKLVMGYVDKYAKI